jgi:hypothetical protein
MLSDNDKDGNDQSSYENRSCNDDEMIHNTASKKEVRNLILLKFCTSSNQTRQSMGEDSIFLMFDGESIDESDDSYDAEDENDVDCNIYQELYSTSSSSYQTSRG